MSGPPGDIEFTDEELRELGLELVESDEARRKRKKSLLRVPLDEVPRAPSLVTTLKQHAFSTTDLLVDAAFEKANGAALRKPAAADSPWDEAGDAAEGDAADLVPIEDEMPSEKTAISTPPQMAVPEPIHDAPIERIAVSSAITKEMPAPVPPPVADAVDDDAPISSTPPYVAPAQAAPAPALPSVIVAAAPPPVPDDAPAEGEDQVVSSSPAPDRSGPRVAVTDEVSGRVAGNRAQLKVEASEELQGDDLEEVQQTQPGVPPPPPPTAPATTSAAPPVPSSASAPPPVPSAKVSAPNLAAVAAPPPPAPSLAAGAPSTNGAAVAPPPVPAASAEAPSSAAAEEKPRRKRRAKQWFEEIFDEDYLRTLPFMTPRQTEREAAFIVEALGIRDTAALLDIGCGYGRHAMELAARGHKVTGLDLSLPLLIRAADAARRVGVNVNFVHGDMREMTFEEEFDAAYCFFTTFGYFDDDSNRKVLGQVGKALKPGGRFLLDVINRDYLIGDLPTRVWWQGDACVILEEVDFNFFTSRLQVQRSIVFEDGRQLEQEISIRSYSLHEIGKILHHAGFRVIEVSGGLSLRGKFFGTEARQILVVAEKRKEP